MALSMLVEVWEDATMKALASSKVSIDPTKPLIPDSLCPAFKLDPREHYLTFKNPSTKKIEGSRPFGDLMKFVFPALELAITQNIT
jgi:hypothetical protein